MAGAQFIPPIIRETENSWHTEEVYKNAHYYSIDNNFFAVMGGNGTGKTMLALRSGEILGWDKRNEPSLFNPKRLWEHVVFEKQELMNIINELNKKPLKDVRGYTIVVDEVQDAMSSKEAMQEEVRSISSYLATLRSRRYIIYFTLPSWNMLVKDARRIMNYAHIMTRRPTTVSYSDLRYIKTDRMSDEPRLWRPRRVQQIADPLTGLPYYYRPKWSALQWHMPSREITRVYAKLKTQAQQKKSQRLTEKMDRALQEQQQDTAEGKVRFEEWLKEKIPSEDKLTEFVKVYNGRKTLIQRSLSSYLGLYRDSKTFKRSIDMLLDFYPGALADD